MGAVSASCAENRGSARKSGCGPSSLGLVEEVVYEHEEQEYISGHFLFDLMQEPLRQISNFSTGDSLDEGPKKDFSDTPIGAASGSRSEHTPIGAASASRSEHGGTDTDDVDSQFDKPKLDMPSRTSYQHDANGIMLAQFLNCAGVVLIRASYFRKLVSKGGVLQRRQDLPVDVVVEGTKLDRELRFNRSLQVWTVSHPWLTLEHPDPTGVRAHELVIALDELRAVDTDLVFVDFCCLPQVKAKSGSFFFGAPGSRTVAEERCFLAAKANMDVLFVSSRSNVILLPTIHVLTNASRWLTKNSCAYRLRAWCYLESVIATHFGRVVKVAAAEPDPDLDPGCFHAESLTAEQFEVMVRGGHFRLNEPQDTEIVLSLYRRFCLARTI